MTAPTANVPTGVALEELKEAPHACGSRAVYVDRRRPSAPTAYCARCGANMTARIDDAENRPPSSLRRRVRGAA